MPAQASVRFDLAADKSLTGEGPLAEPDRTPGDVEPRRRTRGMGPRVPAPVSDGAVRHAIHGRDAFFRRSLVGADLTAAAVAYLLAAGLVGDGARWPALLALPLVVMLCKLAGLYDRDELLIDKATSVDEIPKLFNVAALLALSAALAGETVVQGGLAAFPLLVFWLALASLLVLFRAAARSFALRLTPTERCLVVGDADASAQFSSKLAESPHINSCVIGYVPLADRIRSDDPPPLGTLQELAELIIAHDVHRVIVAPRDTDSDDQLDIVRSVKALGVKLSVLPRIFEVVGSSSEFDDLDGLTVLGVPRFGLTRSSRTMKRTLDLVGAGVGLVLTSPFLAAIAVAIKLGSPGPVLFRQQRVGHQVQVF